MGQDGIGAARDVMIGIGFKIDKFKDSFRGIKNEIKSKMVDTKRELENVMRAPLKNFAAKNGMFKSDKIAQLKERYKDLGLQLKQVGINEQKALAPLQTEQIFAKNNLNKLTAAANKTKLAFKGWALSMMFFGMAIQRVTNSIWKNSMKTFQDVMHSTEGTVTGFDMLEGSMKYLGFTMGQALEPIVSFIVPIIDAVQDWVQNNEELTRILVTFFTIIGAALTTGGMLVLAREGFKGLGIEIGGVKGLANGLKTFDWAALGNKIRTGIGVLEIALGIANITKAAIDLAHGDIDATIKDAIKGIGQVATGVGVLAGNPYAIAIGVMLQLIGEGVFLQTMLGISAVITGIIQTTLQTIWDMFADSFLGQILNVQNSGRTPLQNLKKNIDNNLLNVRTSMAQAELNNEGSSATTTTFLQNPSFNIVQIAGESQEDLIQKIIDKVQSGSGQ